MIHFQSLTGTLTEVQRYVNVPMRWCEEYPARERREFWLARTDGVDEEVKLVVHSRSMPARRGHEVCVLLSDETVVGMANLATGGQVNFVRADPPLVLRCGDISTSLVTLLAGGVAAGAWHPLIFVPAAAVGLLYAPLRVLCRVVWRMCLRKAVDDSLEKALAAEYSDPPRLFRVR